MDATVLIEDDDVGKRATNVDADPIAMADQFAATLIAVGELYADAREVLEELAAKGLLPAVALPAVKN